MFSRVNAIRPPPTNIIRMSRTIGRRVNPNVSSPLITGDPLRARLADVYPTSWRGLLLRQNPPPFPPPPSGGVGGGGTTGEPSPGRAKGGSTPPRRPRRARAPRVARPPRARPVLEKRALVS